MHRKLNGIPRFHQPDSDFPEDKEGPTIGYSSCLVSVQNFLNYYEGVELYQNTYEFYRMQFYHEKCHSGDSAVPQQCHEPPDL